MFATADESELEHDEEALDVGSDATQSDHSVGLAVAGVTVAALLVAGLVAYVISLT